MTTTGKNFSGLTSIPGTETHYVRCNFSQPDSVDSGGLRVGIAIAFPDAPGPITFDQCNLMNCAPPAGSVINGGNTAINARQTEVEELVVDGVPIGEDVEYHENHGRRMPDGTYEYKPSPERVD